MLNLNSWKTRSHPWFRQRSGVCRLRNKLSRFTSTNIHVKNNSSCLTYMHFNCLKFVLGIHRSQPVWRDCNKKKNKMATCEPDSRKGSVIQLHFLHRCYLKYLFYLLVFCFYILIYVGQQNTNLSVKFPICLAITFHGIQSGDSRTDIEVLLTGWSPFYRLSTEP